jgi:hypothetical protein
VKTIVPLEVLEKLKFPILPEIPVISGDRETFAINIYFKKKARKPPPDDLQAKQKLSSNNTRSLQGNTWLTRCKVNVNSANENL